MQRIRKKSLNAYIVLFLMSVTMLYIYIYKAMIYLDMSSQINTNIISYKQQKENNFENQIDKKHLINETKHKEKIHEHNSD